MTSLLDKMRHRFQRHDQRDTSANAGDDVDRAPERALDDARDTGARLEEGFGDTLNPRKRKMTD